MRKLDWQEITAFYNGIFNKDYKTPSTMLRNAYKRFKVWDTVALKLGISYEMIRQYRKAHPEIDAGYNKGQAKNDIPCTLCGKNGEGYVCAKCTRETA